MRTIVTPEDLLATEGTPAGWYPAEIIKYDEEVTKGSTEKPSDGSMNAIFTFKLLDGPTKGREMKRYFNEKPKAMAFAKSLWAILFGKDWMKAPLTTEMFQASVGKKVGVYVKKQDNGKFDEIADYRPLA